MALLTYPYPFTIRLTLLFSIVLPSEASLESLSESYKTIHNDVVHLAPRAAYLTARGPAPASVVDNTASRAVYINFEPSEFATASLHRRLIKKNRRLVAPSSTLGRQVNCKNQTSEVASLSVDDCMNAARQLTSSKATFAVKGGCTVHLRDDQGPVSTQAISTHDLQQAVLRILSSCTNVIQIQRELSLNPDERGSAIPMESSPKTLFVVLDSSPRSRVW